MILLTIFLFFAALLLPVLIINYPCIVLPEYLFLSTFRNVYISTPISLHHISYHSPNARK